MNCFTHCPPPNTKIPVEAINATRVMVKASFAADQARLASAGA
jgi:hypothetical protein